GTLAVRADVEGAGVTLRLDTSATRVVNVLEPARLSGVTVDANGLAGTEIVRIASGVELVGCHVTDSGFVATYGLVTNGKADGVTIEGCRLDGLNNAIRVTDGSSNFTIRGNRITQWRQRGIWIANGDCSNVTIEGNRVTDLAPGGS